MDPVTKRMVVLAGGLTGYGTVAAGEFLSNPAYMESITAAAPRKWSRLSAVQAWRVEHPRVAMRGEHESHLPQLQRRTRPSPSPEEFRILKRINTVPE